MKSAYCPRMDRLVTSDKVCTKGYSGLRYVCPECRHEVRYRNWRNAPPYFAHTRFNPSCSLSVEDDGLFFSGRDRQGNPVDPVDLEKIAEGIRTDILIGAGRTLMKTNNMREKAAGTSCLVMAEEFGSPDARQLLEERYGASYLDFTPLTITEIRDVTYEKGRQLLDKKKVEAAWDCIYLSSQLGNTEAQHLLEEDERLVKISGSHQKNKRTKALF